jgi:hypothetical protein
VRGHLDEIAALVHGAPAPPADPAVGAQPP